MKIDGTPIGQRHPPYIVAELSCNHNGELSRALKLIDAAKAAGVSGVKFQAFQPQRLAQQRGGADTVLKDGLWAGRTLGELYGQCQTPYEWFADLVQHCQNIGLTWFSSVFHVDDVDFLEVLDIPAYKIASFECGHSPLISRAASTGKPIIVSTGTDAGGTTGHGVKAALDAGTMHVALLHCVSAYPCPVEKANLSRIQRLRHLYQLPVGWSDHTVGVTAAVAAVASGACIVERHIKLNNWDDTPDAAFSSDPSEMRALVKLCQDVWAACRPTEQIEPFAALKSNVELETA